jgi:hypothetical protein
LRNTQDSHAASAGGAGSVAGLEAWPIAAVKSSSKVVIRRAGIVASLSIFRMSIATGGYVRCFAGNYFTFLIEVSTVAFEGRVEGLFIAGQASADMVSLAEVVAVADRGLEGDRYFYRRGSYSHWPGRGRDVTLIEAEVLTSLPDSCAISGAQARRNIVTRGLRLNNLVGQFFQMGEVVLYGVRLCEPCPHLDKLTRPGVMATLVGRGGLRADIIESGVIRVGDVVSGISAQ